MIEDRHGNDSRFIHYYQEVSAARRATERARGIYRSVLSLRASAGDACEELLVADVGCNAGTQARVWLDAGHRVRGLDISRELVEIASQRNDDFAGRGIFEVGSATELPWPDESFDVCLMPELLEHVEDWRRCIEEAIRVLKRGGTLYLSTTNVLCPVQAEFRLPLYSWYPGCVKHRLVAKAKSTSPHWVNFAKYPALHWFSPYGLKRFLGTRATLAYDRFDMLRISDDGSSRAAIGRIVTSVPGLRFIGHVLTPWTTIVARKAVTR